MPHPLPEAPLAVHTRASLREHNSFGLPAVAARLVRIASEADVRRVVDHPELGRAPKFILGGGSNIVLTRDVDALVLKVEIMGRRLLEERPDGWLLEVGAGESWHGTVAWAMDNGWPGLENLALIPGLVGAEHRRLRRGAEGPLPFAGRCRPGHRPHRHARP
jgi:UDP-N-acetylmuramate dehydrogenase